MCRLKSNCLWYVISQMLMLILGGCWSTFIFMSYVVNSLVIGENGNVFFLTFSATAPVPVTVPIMELALKLYAIWMFKVGGVWPILPKLPISAQLRRPKITPPVDMRSGWTPYCCSDFYTYHRHTGAGQHPMEWFIVSRQKEVWFCQTIPHGVLSQMLTTH